ncbi:MAG: MarC family protein [Actinomycetota bacterium]|jgi:multiple antibiotic resistance protein|nr:MarC family protein [Rubrobacter sp.]MDQ3506915.1 MarC family protein [Actinomycetota bacterium]
MAEFLFNALITLLVVVDPPGLAPIFAALTRGYSEKRKRETAIRGVLVGAGILLVFALIGDVLLGALGISLDAFRIAGGILLFILALDMVFASPRGVRSRTISEQEEDDFSQDVTVFPLAIPLLAGPGAIATVLLFTGGREPFEIAAFIGVLLFVLSLTLASLLLAPKIMSLMGETGASVLSRVLGVVIAALAVQFVLDGVMGSMA